MEVGTAGEKRTINYGQLPLNIPSIMVTSTFVGGFDATLFSSSLINFYLGVFCIVPFTWLVDSGTGVSGYLSICSMSTSAWKAWYKMLPKRSCVIDTERRLLFLLDTL